MSKERIVHKKDQINTCKGKLTGSRLSGAWGSKKLGREGEAASYLYPSAAKSTGTDPT